MRRWLALVIVALASLPAAGAAAQAPLLYYCDPLYAYYPAVPRCPVPWRAVGSAPIAPQPYQAPVPPSAAPRFPALGDGLDDWCAEVKLPSSVAICSDPELRSLMIERQRAYDEARSQLTPDQQKALLADQNGWVRSYPRVCGLGDAPPSLPLATSIKNCVAEAGRARIAYLKAYSVTSAAPSETNGAGGETTSAPAKPEQAGAQYRCRDPNTNFVYERPQPCAKGDVMLSGPSPIPSEQAPSQSAVPAAENQVVPNLPSSSTELVSDVQILSIKCAFTVVGPEVQGEIKNVSPQPLEYVVIMSSFFDGQDKFVSTTELNIAFNPLLPGQISPFDGYGGLNPVITKVTVAPAIMSGRALSNSGIQSAPCDQD